MKKIYITSIIALVVAASIGAAAWSISSSPTPAAPPKTTVAQNSQTQHHDDITYTATAGISSLEQLKHEASDVVTKQSSYGEYVDSIEGYAGGTDGKYWSFYVDGAMSDVGANSYIQKGGEHIEWKFQKL